MRPGKVIVVTIALVAASCGGTAASDDAPTWPGAIPDSLETSPFHTEVAAQLEASLAADPLIPASCVAQVAADVTDVLFIEVGEVGLRNLGVTPDDASAVGTDAFFAALPAAAKGSVVAAVAGCDGVSFQLSPQIPGVSYASFSCLVDRLSASGFFENGFIGPAFGEEETVAGVTFTAAKATCLDSAEQEAYDGWSARQLAAHSPLALSPIECASIDPAPFVVSLGFDIESFEPSLIITDSDRPVGCAYGDPDGQGPWVMLYVATQDFQRGLYEAYEPPIPEVAEVWPDLTEILEYAGVYFIASGGNVEWLDGAVTATFDDGNTSAAVTAGDYLVMVSAGPGRGGAPLSRAHLAGAVEALATTLALS
jgi:hypothetical protein